MKACTAIIATTAFFAGFSAQAQVEPEKCLKQMATLSISYNARVDKIAAAKEKLDKDAAQIQETAKQVGVKALEVQSNSTNISGGAGNQDGGFQVNNNISYIVTPPEAAQKLAEALTEKGFRINLNIHSSQSRCDRGR